MSEMQAMNINAELESLRAEKQAAVEQERKEQEEYEAKVQVGAEIMKELGVSYYTKARAVSIYLARKKGADFKTLLKLAKAEKLSRRDWIELDRGPYDHLSRGRGWCRRKDGVFFNDYKVGPGEYTVGSTDGFRRTKRFNYKVEHVKVGDEVWTIAN